MKGFYLAVALGLTSILYAQSQADLANQAEALLRSGDTQNGIALLNQAAQASSATAESEDHIGFLLAVVGRGPDALTHFDKAIQLNGDYAPAHYHKGVALWLAKDHEHGLPRIASGRQAATEQF